MQYLKKNSESAKILKNAIITKKAKESKLKNNQKCKNKSK